MQVKEMTIHLHNEIEKLKKRILELSAKVEDNVRTAMYSLTYHNEEQAHKVIESDDGIDDIEVEIEEDCLKTLALHQPVAIDLRFIVSVLKINNDLERIGDLAANIASSALVLIKKPEVEIPSELNVMAEKSELMLKRSLDAFINLDTKLSRSVCKSDDEVDELLKKIYMRVGDKIKEEPSHTEYLFRLLSIGRHLERIADLATNIAEDVIYLVEGTIVRHRVLDSMLEEEE